MGRTFLTCLPQLQLEENSFHFSVNNHAVLFAALEYDVQKLREAISRDSLTLQWCTEALILLRRMHSQFLLVFYSFKLPMSCDGVSEVLDEYMNESLQILELCNLLKSATSDMNRYRLQLDIAMKSKCFEEYLAVTQTLERVEKVQNTIKGRHVGSSLKRSTRSSAANFISAIRASMSIISSILFCSILHQVPVELEKEIYCEFPQMKSFLNSVQDLARCFNEQLGISGEKSFPDFVEYELIEKAVKDAKTQLRKHSVEGEEGWQGSKVSIQQKLADLKAGLELFESEITQVFEEVLNGRNQLLQQITTKTY